MGPTELQVNDERSVNLLSTMLVASNIVDRFDMSWAERESRRKAKPLMDMLVELELVTPLQVQTCFESLKRTGKLTD